MERLDGLRAWDSLTTGQQTERLARAKREDERGKAAYGYTAVRLSAEAAMARSRHLFNGQSPRSEERTEVLMARMGKG